MGKPSEQTIEIVARGIWIENSKVLLCRNLAAGYSYFPGGHVEFGEPASLALEREFAEECGENIKAGRCLLTGETTFTQNRARRHEFNIVFHVEPAPDSSAAPPRATSAVPRPIRSLEPHIAFEWVPIAALPSSTVLPKWLADELPALIEQLGRSTQAPPGGAIRDPHTKTCGTSVAWMSAIES